MKLVKVEMHLHTGLVSPCSVLSPLQIVRAYAQADYGGVFITDHYYRAYFESMGDAPWREKVDAYMAGYHEVQRLAENYNLRVYLGMELTRVHCRADLLLVGLDEEFLYEHPNLFALSHQELYHLMDESGILLCQAHPFRYGNDACPAELLHGIEVHNAHPVHASRNDMARAFAGAHPHLLNICGSDAHSLMHVCRGGVYLPPDLKDAREVARYIREQGSPKLVVPPHKKVKVKTSQ